MSILNEKEDGAVLGKIVDDTLEKFDTKTIPAFASAVEAIVERAISEVPVLFPALSKALEQAISNSLDGLTITISISRKGQS